LKTLIILGQVTNNNKIADNLG